jgi:DNA-binding transcriptional LysR family regulator
LRLAQEAATTARRVAKGEQGSLAIGFTATIGYGLLPELVRELRTRVPHISLTLKELVTTAQLEALDSGQLDLGLMRPHIEHHGLKSMSLSREGLMLAIPERDASLWPEHPDLQNLQGAPLLMYSPYEASYFYRLLHDCLDRLDVKPDVVEYVSQIHTMLALVSSGMGVALIPASAARLQFRGITLRHVRTAPPAPVELVASWRQDNDNPLLKVLRQEVLTMLSSG